MAEPATSSEWIASGLAGRTPRQSPLLWSSPTVALRHHSLRAVAAVDTWIDFGSPAETNNCASAIYITHLKLRFPPYIIVYLNLPENMVPLNPILNHHVHSFSPFILPFAGDTWWYGIPQCIPNFHFLSFHLQPRHKRRIPPMPCADHRAPCTWHPPPVCEEHSILGCRMPPWGLSPAKGYTEKHETKQGILCILDHKIS